jgi:hypothetical protein
MAPKRRLPHRRWLPKQTGFITGCPVLESFFGTRLGTTNLMAPKRRLPHRRWLPKQTGSLGGSQRVTYR